MKFKMFITAIMATVFIVGCANETPVQLATNAHNVYDITMSGLTEARQAGLISDTQKAQIEKVRSPLYDSIKALDAAAVANNTVGFQSTLTEVNAQLDALKTWLLTAKAQKPSTPLK